jgi:hypothetical protein
VWNREGSQTKLGAVRTRQGRDPIGSAARCGIARDRRPARIVAVESETGVDVHLGAAPRTYYHSAFGTHQPRMLGTTIRAVARIHPKAVSIGTKSRKRPEPRRPFHLVLGEDTGARLIHRILTHGFKPHPCFRVVQADI